MKILLEAYACRPGCGSEPGVGWNVALETARAHDVWLLTSAANRAAVEAGLAACPEAARIRAHYPDFPTWLWRLLRRRPLHFLHAYLWPWLALRAARRLHARHGFDLAHHVTFASWRYPTWLYRLGVPFVWGPLGGGEAVPPALAGVLGIRGRLKEGLRAAAQRAGTFDPFVRRAMRSTSLVLAANAATCRFLRRAFGREAEVLPAIGVEPLPRDEVREDAPPPPFTVASVGVFVPLKAFSLALAAFARALGALPAGSRLLLLGDGPERGRLERLARRLALGPENVRFLGWRTRDEVRRILAQSHALLFPSLRDSGGMVLLEAMAAGVPTVGLDHGGPAEILAADCGFKVPVGSREDVVRQLAEALVQLAREPALARAMGRAARRRVRRFAWRRKRVAMERVYRRVLAGASLPRNTRRRQDRKRIDGESRGEAPGFEKKAPSRPTPRLLGSVLQTSRIPQHRPLPLVRRPHQSCSCAPTGATPGRRSGEAGLATPP
ncbi:MAG: glycosyltransferase [Planctomycetes bacterium]|nr:glycosyltransferase [Planctomycetota bacterium]